MQSFPEDQRFVYVNNKMMRRGHTTGTCAAAAAKAAALALLTGNTVDCVDIVTPKGIPLKLPVEDMAFGDGSVRCAVRKDGGDDIDVTHGALIYSEVSLSDCGILIDGGVGVGRVTRKGLDQPPGNAAINKVPRSMIREALEDVAHTLSYTGGFKVTVSVPEGMNLSSKTFNPRLGIEGGISILGTSGIVEPMSEAALVKTIVAEMDMRAASGVDVLLVVPGNYGKEFSDHLPGIDSDFAIKCSNFVGEMLDHAVELKKDVLLVSNLGKIVKVAGGIMNTHSRNADCRMEILAAAAARAGAGIESVRGILDCISTDDALEIVESDGLLRQVSEIIAEKVEFYINHRTGGEIRVAAVIFSSVYGLLSKTSLADEMLETVKRECA